MGRISVPARQPQGAAHRAVAARPWLRPVLQLRPRHRHRPHRRRPTSRARHRRHDPAVSNCRGRADRPPRSLRFKFDGHAYEGFAGDTLASALLANDVHLVGRSFKYHRPRGILSAGSEEPNALVTIDRGAGRITPNLRATQVELYDGLIARSQNRFPSLGFDLGASGRDGRAAAVRRVLLQDLHVAAVVLEAALRAGDTPRRRPGPCPGRPGPRPLSAPVMPIATC